MRSKKALINTVTGLLYEIVSVICGLILPRLILSHFGSGYNGITSSITQFISCIALMKAGIGGVSRAALYKALAKEDVSEISAIVKATQRFMSRISAVFVVFVCVFSVGYSMYFSKEFDKIFTISLVFIISISTFGEYFFGFTYEILLSADQKHYVFSIISIVTTILNTVVASILIFCGFGILGVKLGSSVVFLINPIFIRIYARKKYKITDKVEPNKNLLAQRWDAIGHEIANFVNTNTDIMVLTVFTDVLEVSVYTVYNTVVVGVRKLVNTFINGFGAAFGNMYAKGEMELMEKNFRVYELIVFSLSSVIYSITTVMFVPYAQLYTKGVTDVEYARPLFAYIIAIAGAFSCIRIPYQNIVTVAGHFKQTRNGAFAEAGINIVISVICVIRLGLVGVAIGTIVANIFRTVQYAIYMSSHILKRSIWLFVKHVMVFIMILAGVNIFSYFLIDIRYKSAFEWIISAAEVGVVSVLLTILGNVVFYMTDSKRLIKKMYGMFKNR